MPDMSPIRVAREAMKYAVFGVMGQLGRIWHLAAAPVLTYHSLDDLGSTMSTTAQAFRRQVLYLKREGFQSIRLSDLVDALREGEVLDAKSFVLTFDDGFRSVYDVAFPLLRELDFTATVFPVAGYLGKTCGWEVGEANRRVGAHEMALMTWGQMREMSQHGFEFGSHGWLHRRLTELSVESVREELRRSKAELEDQLEGPCTQFCYPYGAWNDVTRDLVREAGFRAAVTLRFGWNDASTDVYTLRRIGSARFTNFQVFKACIHGTYGWHRRVMGKAY